MTEAKHTPGPWAIHERASSCSVLDKPYYHVSVTAPGGEPMADGTECIVSAPATASEDRHANNIANARLIAAAPELLEALQTILADYDQVTQEGPDLTKEAVLQARGAIAKATGSEAA